VLINRVYPLGSGSAVDFFALFSDDDEAEDFESAFADPQRLRAVFAAAPALTNPRLVPAGAADGSASSPMMGAKHFKLACSLFSCADARRSADDEHDGDGGRWRCRSGRSGRPSERRGCFARLAWRRHARRARHGHHLGRRLRRRRRNDETDDLRYKRMHRRFDADAFMIVQELRPPRASLTPCASRTFSCASSSAPLGVRCGRSR
jgi:hypothetical protein